MMEDPISPIIIGVGSSDNANNREIFTVSTSNGVDDAEAANGERDDTGTNPTRPGVSISSIASIELIAAANVVEPRLSNKVIKKGQVEVTRHGEDIFNPNLDKPVSQVTA